MTMRINLANRGKTVLTTAAAAIILSSGLLTLPAQAQQVIQKIEALVNDEVISAFDVLQRMGLVVAASGGVNTEQELMRLQQQVLHQDGCQRADCVLLGSQYLAALPASGAMVRVAEAGKGASRYARERRGAHQRRMGRCGELVAELGGARNEAQLV